MNYLNPNFTNHALLSYNQRLSKVEQTTSQLLSLVNKLMTEIKESEKEEVIEPENPDDKPENEGPITVNTVQVVRDPLGLKFSDGYVYTYGIDRNFGNKLLQLDQNSNNGNWSWWDLDADGPDDLGSTELSIGGQQINSNSTNIYEIEPIAYGDIIEVYGKGYQTLDLQIDGKTMAREL